MSKPKAQDIPPREDIVKAMRGEQGHMTTAVPGVMYRANKAYNTYKKSKTPDSPFQDEDCLEFWVIRECMIQFGYSSLRKLRNENKRLKVRVQFLDHMIENASDLIIESYQAIDDTHKNWVLDQVLRRLMTTAEYRKMRKVYTDWPEGIRPFTNISK